MNKRKVPDLAGLVTTKGQAAPVANVPSRAAAPAAAGDIERIKGDSEPLNFRVPAEFRRRFKTYAAAHDMKLNELLFKSFAEYVERHN